MNHAYLRDRIINRPLLVAPAYAEVIVSVLADKLGLETLVSDEQAQRYTRPAHGLRIDENSGIAVLPIVGSMVHRGGYLDAASGVQSYTELHGKIMSLMDNKKVRGILLDMDTPGGEAAGITELGDWIKQARTEKPIWALANTSMCSGGYWIASAASKIVAAPMANIGSIGVVVMHTDISKAMEKRGIAHTFITAGEHKKDGNPYEPLPESVHADIQESVNSLYEQFVTTVADNRGLDSGAVKRTQARIFDPKQALELGLVDRIGSLGETLAAFAGELDSRNIWSASRGIYMDKEYTNDDLARAVSVATAEAKASLSGEVSAAIRASFSGKRAEAFCAALDKGASLSLAADLAQMIDEPKIDEPKIEAPAPAAPVARGSDFDRLMAANAPGVSPDEPAQMSAGDRVAARKVELAEAAKAVRAARGYK